MSDTYLTRRRFLALAPGALAATAGCTGGSSGSTGDQSPTPSETTTQSGTPTTARSKTTTSGHRTATPDQTPTPTPAEDAGRACTGKSPVKTRTPSMIQNRQATVEEASTIEPQRGETLYETDFGTLAEWVIETEDEDPVAEVTDGSVVLASEGGATMWLDRSFEGNVLVEYTVRIPSDGEHARVSDLNQWWMATGPDGGSPIGRDGAFESYDDVRGYFVAMGGHGNTTTRFRKYPRPRDGSSLYGEYRKNGANANRSYFLTEDTEYTVQVGFYDGYPMFAVDGSLLFFWDDPDPYTEGWFGLRSTKSRKSYRDLSVHRLTDFGCR